MTNYYLLATVTFAILAVFQGLSIFSALSVLLTSTEPKHAAERIDHLTLNAGDDIAFEEIADADPESFEVVPHDVEEPVVTYA